jgi:hypothetical protein
MKVEVIDMWVDKDGWVHPEDQYEPATLAENNPDDVDWEATERFRKNEEEKMARKNTAKKSKIETGKRKAPPGLKQVFAVVNGDGIPDLYLRKPVDSGEGHQANMIPLEGMFVDCPGECKEENAWSIVQRLSDLCRLGSESESKMGNRNAMCEHLAYAYNILTDYVMEFDGDFTMSKETAETLIRGAMDRIVRAGKCIGFDLDKYRIELDKYRTEG